MKIYKVSWICEDDTTQHRFFTAKSDANKLYKKLEAIDATPPNDEDDDNRLVKCLFEIKILDVEISKKGILKLLNNHFSETQ